MLLNLLYDFLKIVVLLILRIFYPYTSVINKDGLKFDRPTIVVSNHPNTLLDAVGVAARVQKRLFFLANASLFANPVANWLLNKLYCIPIMRKEDVEKKKVNNNESFQRSFDHLAGGGSMYIAPEGSSYMERRLRPIKSGTARIALGAEADNGWNLGISILPIGLTYSDPHKFGTRLVFNVGAPIPVHDYREEFEEDPLKATISLTQLLQTRIQALIINTIDDEEDEFLRKLETIDLSEENDLKSVFGNTQSRLTWLRTLEKSIYQDIKDKTDRYFRKLEETHTVDRAVWLYKTKALTGRLWMRIILGLTGLPLFLYGSINHLFAFGIPALATRLARLYIGYNSTVKTLTGLITFPLFYILQFRWVNIHSSTSFAWIYIITLPLAGWLAWQYAGFSNLTFSVFNLRKLSKKGKADLLKARESLKAAMA